MTISLYYQIRAYSGEGEGVYIDVIFFSFRFIPTPISAGFGYGKTRQMLSNDRIIMYLAFGLYLVYIGLGQIERINKRVAKDNCHSFQS